MIPITILVNTYILKWHEKSTKLIRDTEETAHALPFSRRREIREICPDSRSLNLEGNVRQKLAHAQGDKYDVTRSSRRSVWESKAR